MGFNKQDLRFLREQRGSMGSFVSALTIGNLQLDGVKEHRDVESVFRAMGATRFETMDASSYEGAHICHDLNTPLAAGHSQYDVVYDGGTLEHVFNFPVAMANLMKVTALNGSLIIHTVANNFCGHGFYQFSPELLMRCLSVTRGFHVKRMVLFRTGPWPKWREVTWRDLYRGKRLELCSLLPMHMIVHAQKIDEREIDWSGLQQGNYAKAWDTKATPRRPSKLSIAWAMARNYLH